MAITINVLSGPYTFSMPRPGSGAGGWPAAFTAEHTITAVTSASSIYTKIENYLKGTPKVGVLGFDGGSQRYRDIANDLGSASTIARLNVLLHESKQLKNKFYTPHEVGLYNVRSGSGALSGALITVNIRQSKEVCLIKNKKPPGWDVAVGSSFVPTWERVSSRRYWKVYREMGYQSPMMTFMHELGHAWQWIKYKTVYEGIIHGEYNNPVVGTTGDLSMRVEINNVLNNELVAAHELGEGVRWQYGDGSEDLEGDDTLDKVDLIAARASMHARSLQKSSSKRSFPLKQHLCPMTFTHPTLPIALTDPRTTLPAITTSAGPTLFGLTRSKTLWSPGTYLDLPALKSAVSSNIQSGLPDLSVVMIEACGINEFLKHFHRKLFRDKAINPADFKDTINRGGIPAGFAYIDPSNVRRICLCADFKKYYDPTYYGSLSLTAYEGFSGFSRYSGGIAKKPILKAPNLSKLNTNMVKSVIVHEFMHAISSITAGYCYNHKITSKADNVTKLASGVRVNVGFTQLLNESMTELLGLWMYRTIGETGPYVTNYLNEGVWLGRLIWEIIAGKSKAKVKKYMKEYINWDYQNDEMSKLFTSGSVAQGYFDRYKGLTRSNSGTGELIAIPSGAYEWWS